MNAHQVVVWTGVFDIFRGFRNENRLWFQGTRLTEVAGHLPENGFKHVEAGRGWQCREADPAGHAAPNWSNISHYC